VNANTGKSLASFFSQFRTFRYRKDEIILRPGDTPQGVYFLNSGYVRLYSFSKEGKELTLVIYKKGDFFPVVWTLKGVVPSIYYFETLSDVEIQRAPRESFVEFIEKNNNAFMEVNDHILERFQTALKRMQYLAFGNSKSKLASILLICGRDFGVEKNGEIEIQIPFTHKDISNLMGVTRETVSVEIKQFDNRGLIKYNDKLIVLKNIKGLEEEAILI
jgi:CRP/FNR family transcriptional regulator